MHKHSTFRTLQLSSGNSHVQHCATPLTAAHQAPLSSTISKSMCKFMSIESVVLLTILSSATPFSFCLQFFPASGSFPVSQLCIRWPKYQRFSFSIHRSSECSGLISYRIDWFNLLAVEGTLKGLFQHHSWKASILWHSAFFMVQLLHSYVTTVKTIDLTIQISVGK